MKNERMTLSLEGAAPYDVAMVTMLIHCHAELCV